MRLVTEGAGRIGVRSVVPDVQSERFQEGRQFYVELLGFEVGMEMGWVMTLVSPNNHTSQVTIVTEEASAAVQPEMSVEVDDVDTVHAEAVRRGEKIVH